MSGLVNLFKPPAWTSRDAAMAVKRRLGADRAGHTGTLDPGAAGVLLVLLDRATRLQQFFTTLPKVYVAEAALGAAPDTGDAFGEITRVDPHPPRQPDRLEAVLPQFLGCVRQVPPMASAVKVDGRPLYEHARRGRDVRPPSRTVRVRDLRLLRFRPDEEYPRVLLRIECSAGTYVRSLVGDIARAAGTCAHMSFLVRAAVGDFAAGGAVSIGRVDGSVVIPAARALDFLPAVSLGGADAQRVRHGAAPREADLSGLGADGAVRILDEKGRLLAVGEMREREDAADRALQPRRVFVDPLGGWEDRIE